MDRNSINFQELKDKGFTTDQIIEVTKLALDKKITDKQFDIILDHTYSTATELTYIHNIITENIMFDSNEFKIDVNKELEYILNITNKNIRKNYVEIVNKFGTDAVNLIHTYYDTKYGVSGIKLANILLNEEAFKMTAEHYYEQSNYYIDEYYVDIDQICITANERNFLYKYILHYTKKYDIQKHGSIYREVIYYCKKARLSIHNNPLSEAQIEFIVDFIFQSNNKIKKYSYQQEGVYEFVINKAVKENVSLDILRAYIGTKYNSAELEIMLRSDIIKYNQESMLPVDKMITILKSIPDGIYNEYTLKYIFKLRGAERDKLRILLKPENSASRMSHLLSFLNGNLYGKICDPVDNLNHINNDDLEDFFDDIYTDIDIEEFSRLDCRQEYYTEEIKELMFNKFKSYMVPESEDREKHYKVSRFISITKKLVYYAAVDTHACEPIKNYKKRVKEIYELLDTIVDAEFIYKQHINVKNIDSKRFYEIFRDDYYDIYFNLIDLLDTLRINFKFDNERLKSIFNDFNNKILSEIGKDESFTSDDIDKFHSILLNISDHYNQEKLDYLSARISISAFYTMINSYNKLKYRISNFFSHRDEYYEAVLLCALLEVPDSKITSEIKRLNNKIKDKHTWPHKDAYSDVDFMKEQKFDTFVKEKLAILFPESK